MVRVLELFGGIGACTNALKRLRISVEVVDYVEIDKFAVKSFNAIHGTNFEPQDICEWDKDISVDLIMHGSPCQDFSIAGRQAGGDANSGTRSSLMYETLRIVEKLKPKYVIWENVKNILSIKHHHNFDAYQEKIKGLGYRNYYQVLNARDYGIPQNRERVFTVSIRNDIEKDFVFPEKRQLTRFLVDILEDNPDPKYFLSDTCVSSLIKHNARHEAKGTGFIWKPRDPNKYASALRANAALAPTDNTIKVIGLEPKFDGTTNTIPTVQKDNLVAENCRIRRLTPRECWRLMGFSGVDFDKARSVCSDTQLYKQAGNSIVVNVLEAILIHLLEKK